MKRKSQVVIIPEISIHEKNVTAKLKLARMYRGLTQRELAEKIGVTIQQVQKYESGHNKISVGKLKYIADFLDLPIDYFFEKKDIENIDISGNKNLLSIWKNFHKLREEKQEIVTKLIKSLAVEEKKNKIKNINNYINEDINEIEEFEEI